MIHRLKMEVQAIPRLVIFLIFKFFKVFKNKYSDIIVFISENADWSIRWDGLLLQKYLSRCEKSLIMDIFPKYYFNTTIHFGSLNTFARSGYKLTDGSNKIIVTIFHGDFGISKTIDQYLNTVIDHQKQISKIIVSNKHMKNRLIDWGINSSKIEHIPIPIDTSLFNKLSESQRTKLRNKLGIPKNAICIGSFQKDGEGWNEGNRPKYIKGPDIFLSIMEHINKNQKIHCLLTGPARGYVINGLKNLKIPYTHIFLENYHEINDYYNCLDLYIICSREEGGPKSILESMATGVPVMSTNVGMAPDIIKNGENGYIFHPEDMKSFDEMFSELFNKKHKLIIKNGFESSTTYSWKNLIHRYISLYERI